MILVVEGPDGAGKTTFAKSFKGDYRHEGPPPTDLGDGNLYAYYFEKVRRWPFAGTRVYDRLALGEVVYGPILRGTSRLGRDDYHRFVEATRRLGVAHVLCLPPYEACLANWTARAADGHELIRDLGVFNRTYEAFAAWAPAMDLVHDYTLVAR